jgi:hypothetical protein
MTNEVDEMSAASRGYAAPQQRFDAALDDLLSAAHQRGLSDGLAVARKIRDWLTRQPDREWQRQVREWADAEIAKAERKKA